MEHVLTDGTLSDCAGSFQVVSLRRVDVLDIQAYRREALGELNTMSTLQMHERVALRA